MMIDENREKKLTEAKNYIRDLQQELEKTNQGMIALTMELEQAQAELTILNERLEQHVKERTIQLEDINKELESEIAERKQIENELQEEQRRLKETQALGKLGNWEYDVDTGEITWADETYVIYERDPKMGPPTVEEESAYYSTEQEIILRDYARRAIENKEHFRYDFKAIMPGGKEKYLTATMTPIPNKKGRVIRLFGTVQDITDRKEAEELYANITAGSPIGIYIFQDGKFCFVNQQLQMATGYSETELLNMAPYELIHPEDRENAREHSTMMLKGTRESPYEFRIINRNGDIRWAMETVTSIHYNGKQATLGNFMDITENKLAEEALNQTEEKLRITIDSIPQGIMVNDMDGYVSQVNKSAAVMLTGDTEAGIIGSKMMDYISREDRYETREIILDAIQKDEKKFFEYTAVRKDGSTFPAEMAIAIIRNTSGAPVGIIGVFEDITERKKMQEQLMVTDRLASVGELAAGIAHELNNPLTGVIGFSDLLMTRDDIADDIKEDLVTINREAIRASQVARHLLTFARKHPDEKQEVDVNSVLQLVLNLRAYEQRVNNIEVKSELDENLPPVMANDFQLQQVFLNIIINAEHFMIAEHGRGILGITTEQFGDVVCVKISDNGPGISFENIGRIFDPFFTTKEVGKGTGLGLSICYGIITEHGGRIQAESEEGKGTTFTIELPAVK